MPQNNPIKGRGAQQKVHNRFFEHQHETLDDYLNYCEAEGEQADKNQTKYIEVFPKTFVIKLPVQILAWIFGKSVSRLRTCCVYCYARNTHEYWGYGAGLDFERTILVKKQAPRLLEEQLKKNNWEPNTIVLVVIQIAINLLNEN